MLPGLSANGTRATIALESSSEPAPSLHTGTSTRNDGTSRGGHLLTSMDLLGMLVGVAYMLTITVVLSRGRIFWEDEMLGWMLLRDPSWTHMVAAWRAGADGGGFTFYLLARWWMRVFGPSELAFRLYSSACFALAFVVTWAAARRYYSIGIVAFALFNSWFFCTPFVMHMREGRFYGQLILAITLILWLNFAVAETPRKTPVRFYLLMFLSHALLTTSHLLGVVFSAFLLGATIWLDHLERTWRPRLYLCGAASWLLLLPEKQNIIASALVGKPHFWVKPPTFLNVLQAYSGWSVEIHIVLCTLLIAACLSLRQQQTGFLNALLRSFHQRRPVYIGVAALLLIPLAFLIEGVAGTWLFAERYLLPVNIALAFVTAECCHIILGGPFLDKFRRRTLLWKVSFPATAIVFAACLIFYDFHHVREATLESLDYTEALTAKLPRGIPIVCEDAFTFTDLIGRQHASGVQYMFLLDWQNSIAASAPPVEVTQYHLMQNWRNVGYFSGSIQPIDEFLARNARFITINAALPDSTDPPEIGNPLHERLRDRGGYEVRRYAVLERRFVTDTAWLVCRKTCSP